MISIIRSSAMLVVRQRPVVAPPVVEMVEGSPAAFCWTRPIEIWGEVGFDGEKADSTKGWTVGLIQAVWWVEDWAYYRGERHTDGSVLSERDEAQSQRACRDCAHHVSDIFCNPHRGQRPLLNLWQWPQVELRDEPWCSFPTTRLNALTRKLNYLREAVYEQHFCTVLSVRDPKGKFHHLRYVYWGLRWHATFDPRTFDERSVDFHVQVQPRGREVWVSPVVPGEPTRATPLGAKFADVLTSPQHWSCNEMPVALKHQRSATSEMLLPGRHGPRGSPPHVPLAWRT